MTNHIKIMTLTDFSADRSEREYWSSKSTEERLEAVEVLRARRIKIQGKKKGNGIIKGLRRVLRFTKLI